MKKIFLILTASLLSANISFTCYFDDSEIGYDFFKQEFVKDPTYILFVHYQAGLSLGYSEEAQAPKDMNIESWKQYLKAEIKQEDIAELVYKMGAQELSDLILNKKALQKYADEGNQLAAHWTKNTAVKNLMGNYLVFAKQCEVIAVEAADYYWEEVERDQKEIQKLMEEGLSKAKKQKDDFIKRRYLFQAIRMAFYMNDFNLTIKLFNDHFSNSKQEDYIYFRALELKAGALYKMGNSEASYLFSKVFLNCPDRRFECLNSFSFGNAEDWNRSISLCKNNEEKAVFHAMRGLQPTANILEELENIVTLTPNSPMLEVLVARQISKLQQLAFPAYQYEPNVFPISMENNNSLKRLREITRSLRNNPQVENKDYWILAAAYVELMDKKSNEAISLINKIQSGSYLYQKARAMKLIAKTCSMELPNPQLIDEIWSEFIKDGILTEDWALNNFLKEAFSMLYLRQGDKARAFLAHNHLYNLKGRLDLELLDALEFYLTNNAESDNSFDEFLMEERCVNQETGLSIVHEMRGVYYLQRNKLDKAIAEFEKCSKTHKANGVNFNNMYIDKNIWTESILQPYYETNVDDQALKKLYLQYDFLDKDYNLLSYAKQLKELENKAKNEPDKASEYYYLLALAWYNTSNWGWNRPALYYTEDNSGSTAFWSATKEISPVAVYRDYAWTSSFYYDAGIAGSYAEKAIEVSNNKEFKAKALFLLAKIEKTKNYLDYYYYYDEEPKQSDKYWMAFKELKANYSKTKYYQEAISACYDFWNYVYTND